MILGSLQAHASKESLRCLIAGYVYRSKQNGMVYDPDGVASCLCVGNHGGVSPKIILYETY